MGSAHILIVEDDASLRDILRYNLEQVGYSVEICPDGPTGLAAARRKIPRLVILDLMLPGMDGIEVCRRLRSSDATKASIVLMLTAKSEEADQVIGFSVGADDYVTKPFSVQVLLQRIKALLRRGNKQDQLAEVLQRDGIRLDRMRHVVTAEGQELDLTPSEFELLQTLMQQPGRAFKRSDLIDAALGNDAMVLERTIDVHIRSLRKKLGKHAELVQTVRGVGYRFRGE